MKMSKLDKFSRESCNFNADVIADIEKEYRAEYVIDTSTPGGMPCSVFCTEEAHPVSNSRYFALYWGPNEAFITNGAFVENQTYQCVMADDGEIIHSRHRHDYRTSKDGSVWIDGGREYTRSGWYSGEKWITVQVRDGKIVEVQ
jgi:hypothetical protein